MTKFAIRSISQATMSKPADDQARYYSKAWATSGALVEATSKDALTFKSKKAAEQFVKDVATSGFVNIRVQEVF